VTEFAVPTATDSPWTLTVGPDSNIWFTEASNASIGRVDGSGAITEFAVPADPYGIARGPDGQLWFTEQQAGKIGRFLVP
jgi:virginiamycin B lyase